MKIKLYYVVKESDEFYTTEHQTFEFVAVPFGTYEQAKEVTWQDRYLGCSKVVEQVIDVQY